jgi:uncharacterized RDD family membrane protein YckC
LEKDAVIVGTKVVHHICDPKHFLILYTWTFCRVVVDFIDSDVFLFCGFS